MLAVAGAMPRNEDAWAFELKWDGIRAIAHWDGEQLRFETRNLRDVTVAYPELQPLGKALGKTPVILDGVHPRAPPRVGVVPGRLPPRARPLHRRGLARDLRRPRLRSRRPDPPRTGRPPTFFVVLMS